MSPSQPPLDAHQVHEVAILVTTSSPDSGSSIGTGSPTLLIPEPLLHGPPSSGGCPHATPTVKFAPLPQTDPHRKRSLAPLGVPGRSRRIRVIQQEGGSLLWSADPEMPEESAEDPIVSFAKFVKKTGKTLWQRVRRGGRAVPQGEDVECAAEPVLDIKSADDMADGERMSEAVGLGRPASWSPSSLAERRTLSRDKARRSTSDLPRLSLSAVP